MPSQAKYIKRISRFFSEPKHHNVMLDLNPLSEWTSIVQSLGISISFVNSGGLYWLTEVYIDEDIQFLIKPEVYLSKGSGYAGSVSRIDLENYTLYEFVSFFLYDPLVFLEQSFSEDTES
jgi:hypothetical protein